MKLLTITCVILFGLSSWQKCDTIKKRLNTLIDPVCWAIHKQEVVDISFARSVNWYYRTTGDLEGYVEIVTSMYDVDVANRVFERGA